MEITSDEDNDELEDDDDAESSEGNSGNSGSDDNDDSPQRRHKPFIPPPPRVLPQRTTRGQRMGAVVAVQDDNADEEFWNQEFFAEEERDEIYETESEPEDRFDQDFLESVRFFKWFYDSNMYTTTANPHCIVLYCIGQEEEESDGEAAEEDAKAKEPKKKVLKPPGYKRPPPTKKSEPVLKLEGGAVAGATGASPPSKKPRRTSAEVHVPMERTVGVRESTRQKVMEGEEERKLMEAVRGRSIFLLLFFIGTCISSSLNPSSSMHAVEAQEGNRIHRPPSIDASRVVG